MKFARTVTQLNIESPTSIAILEYSRVILVGNEYSRPRIFVFGYSWRMRVSISRNDEYLSIHRRLYGLYTYDPDPMLSSVHQIYCLPDVFSHILLNIRPSNGVYITPLRSNLVYLRPPETVEARILENNKY